MLDFLINNKHQLSCFMIGNYSLFTYLYCLKEQTTYIYLLKTLNQYVLKHSLMELFTSKKYDTIIYRICMSGFCAYSFSRNDLFSFSCTLLNTEIPNIFYTLKKFIPKYTLLYDVNYILFYLTFFKFRIYDFYEILNTGTSICIVGLYVLYIINLYCFVKMNNKVFHKIKMINTYLINCSICTYLHFLNIPLSLFMYSYRPSKRYIYDMIGITLLSISTYDYHYNVYNRILKNNDEYTVVLDTNNIQLLLKECLFIHLRSYLSILTNYYHVNTSIYILIVSGIFHLYSFFLENINVIHIFLDESQMDVFLDCHKIILGVPVACDCLLIFMNSPTPIATPFLLVNALLIIVLIVKPFDKMTEFAFQSLLILQTYYACLSNLNSIYH